MVQNEIGRWYKMRSRQDESAVGQLAWPDLRRFDRKLSPLQQVLCSVENVLVYPAQPV